MDLFSGFALYYDKSLTCYHGRLREESVKRYESLLVLVLDIGFITSRRDVITQDATLITIAQNIDCSSSNLLNL